MLCSSFIVLDEDNACVPHRTYHVLTVIQLFLLHNAACIRFRQKKVCVACFDLHMCLVVTCVLCNARWCTPRALQESLWHDASLIGVERISVFQVSLS